ncbi:MAG: peptidase M28, partial [Chloroflexota bacterium]
MENTIAPVENSMLDALSSEEPWALIERFTTLVRESASDDEREAAKYIVDRLEALGVPHEVHEPELFLSVPVKSSLV